MKRIVSILLALLMLFSLVACGDSSAAKTDETKEPAKAADVDPADWTAVKAELVKAEDLNVLMEVYGSLTVKAQQFDADGSDLGTSEFYMGTDGFVLHNDSAEEQTYVVCDEQGIYGGGSSGEEEAYGLYCFADEDNYNYFVNNMAAMYMLTWIDLSQEETSAEYVGEESGCYKYRLYYDLDADTIDAMAEAGYTVAEGDQCGYEILVDSSTLLISRCSQFLISGGVETTSLITDRELGSTMIAVPENITDGVFGGTETRTVTLITNPGAEDALEQSYTVAKNCQLQLVAEGYGVYADEACTTQFTGNEDFTADVTVYLKAEG